MPSRPTSIGILVRGIDNNLLEGATVTLTRNSQSISQVTNSKGEAILNLGNLTTWAVGNEVSISASKSGVGRKKPMKANIKKIIITAQINLPDSLI